MRPLGDQLHRMRRLCQPGVHFLAETPARGYRAARQTSLGRTFMAKALLGYIGSDARILDDNQRLRRRVADLEAVVLRLQAENDALAARLHEGELLVVPDSIRKHAVVSA